MMPAPGSGGGGDGTGFAVGKFISSVVYVYLILYKVLKSYTTEIAEEIGNKIFFAF
jgi:hypothetical protein